MIRLMRWGVILLLVIVLAWSEGWWQRDILSTDGPADWRVRRANEATLSAVDLLDQTQWLIYVLPPGQPMVRVITNASLPQSFIAATPTEEWQYVLQYQVLGRTGEVLLDREYAHRTQLTTYTDAQTGETFTRRFYLHGERLPANGKVMVINLHDLPEEATQLRLRVAAPPAPILDVVARVYCRESETIQKLPGTWQRLSVKNQQILARGNLYPPELLSEEEKRNLLRQRWNTIAPEGITGVDYTRRDLYALREFAEEEETQDLLLPAGLFVAPTLHGVVTIPEEGGSLRLIFEPLPWERDKIADRTVELRWYGRELTQRKTFALRWDEQGNTVPEVLPGGLVEIVTRQSSVVRVFLTVQGQEQEITPELVVARTYLSEKGTSIEYEIFHEQQQPTPLRVSLRCPLGSINDQPAPLPTIQAQAPSAVWYELLDAQQNILQAGTLYMSSRSSLYDRILATAEGIPVSEPTQYYFSLPAAVVRVRLRTLHGPVLIAGANRPATLTREIQIPEEFYSFADSSAQLGWFTLWPVSAEQLVLDNRVFLIAVQPKPPEDDPEVVAGRYQWEDYQPSGSWRARQLLTPTESTVIRRPQILPVAFHEIPTGQEQVVNFVTADGRQEISPTILYVRPRAASGPVVLRILVDGQMRREILVESHTSQIVLPPLSSGRHRVKVIGPDSGLTFLNYLPPEEASPTVLLRTALHFDTTGFSFDYEKRTTEDETISIRFYAPHNATIRTRVRVRIVGPPASTSGPFLNWTFRDRRYDVRPATGVPIPVLGMNEGWVTEGQLLAIPLGDDLRPGHYRIHCNLEHGPGGYLIFSKITPSVAEQRTVFLERGSTVSVAEE